jgi:ferric-dicitrate binding protein FerR (iron transport regulator)
MNEKPIYPDLLISFLCKECDAHDEIRVRQWIEASAENQSQFEVLQKLWTEAGNAYPPTFSVNTSAAWKNVSRRIDETLDIKPVVHRQLLPNQGFMRGAMLAAAILLPLLAIGLYFIFHEPTPQQLTLIAPREIVKAQLPDGSEINLNKGASLSYPEKFGDNKREVNLEGEAYFKVSHNPGKPFVVHTETIDVMVRGTSFNVRAVPGSEYAEVFVQSGSVAVYALNGTNAPVDSILLKPGDKVVCRVSDHRLELLQPKDENDLFWLSKTLVFKGTELSEVFAALTKNYGVNIAANDSSLLHLRLTTSFDDQALEHIMEVISATLELDIHKKGNQYEVASARK